MTSRGYFGKMNSTLGSVVPLAMFTIVWSSLPKSMTYLAYMVTKAFCKYSRTQTKFHAIFNIFYLKKNMSARDPISKNLSIK